MAVQDKSIAITAQHTSGILTIRDPYQTMLLSW